MRYTFHMPPQHSYFVRVTFGFLPIAIAVGVLAGFFYIAVGQSYRQGANDPQVQMAHAAAQALSSGKAPAEVLPQGTPVAIESNPAPYIILYDRTGTPIAGSGSLHGSAPVLPIGVLSAAQEEGENRLTWQPEDGVRQAIVVVPYASKTTGGYVMAGRSLLEVEKREADLTLMALIATAAALGASFVAVLLREWLA